MIGVELLVLLLAIAAAWLSVRPSPELEWERLWKMTLATVIRGDVESNGGDADIWWERLSAVPYHPAGRDTVAKLLNPSVDDIPVPALEGERALVERLTKKATVSERWVSMFREDPLAEEALTSDPALLGSAYDPSTPLAPNVDWEHIARWTADAQSAISRRMGDVVIAVLGFDEGPLITAVPHARVVAVTESDELAEALMACCPKSQDRLIVVTVGGRVVPTLQALHGNPTLRDRVRTVLCIDADLTESGPWLDTHFQHQEFDTELNRTTLYLAVSNGQRNGMGLVDQTLPMPPVPPSGWAPIESVDLGLLPIDQQNPELLARALWVLFCFCLSSR